MGYVQDFTKQFLPYIQEVSLWFLIISIFCLAAITLGNNRSS